VKIIQFDLEISVTQVVRLDQDQDLEAYPEVEVDL
jgi:hypothetical protein